VNSTLNIALGRLDATTNPAANLPVVREAQPLVTDASAAAAKITPRFITPDSGYG